jgi:hypothetical protein
MANLRISELGAASSLVGTEKVELVQGGVNVQSTVQALATFATSGLPAQAVGIGSRFKIAEFSQNTGAIGFIGPGCTITTVGGVAVPTPDTTVSLLAGIPRYRVQTSGAVNAGHLIDDVGAALEGQWRAVSGSPLGGGFLAVSLFGLSAVSADQKLFCGMLAGVTQPNISSGASGLLNMIGIGKDGSDTNLQFMTNDGSGVATKVDTGIVFTSLLGKLLQLTVSCPQGGATVTVTLKIIDSSTTVTQAFTSNLPATDTQLRRALWIAEGGTATMRLEFVRSWVSYNFFV